MDGAAWIGLGTLVTAVVGLSLVAWQLREQRRGMRAEFGNVYIERYWQIDDDLLLEPKGSERHRQHRLTERFGVVRCMTEGDEWITQAVVSVERCIEELVQGF